MKRTVTNFLKRSVLVGACVLSLVVMSGEVHAAMDPADQAWCDANTPITATASQISRNDCYVLAHVYNDM
jgi:hypothetical protein